MSDIFNTARSAPINPCLVMGTPTGSIAGNVITLGALNQEVIIDTMGLSSLEATLTGTYVATLKVQGSNSVAGPWFDLVLSVSGNRGDFAEATTLAFAATFTVHAMSRYLKVVCSAYTSGSMLVSCFLSDTPMPARGVFATIGSIPNVPLTANSNANSTVLFRRLATADTNLATVKASPGKILGGSVHNLSAAPKFLKLYNKASNPVIGTDVPVMTIPVPANNVITIGDIFSAIGGYFAVGIAIAITGAIGDADATALAANDVVLNLTYV